MAEIVQTLTPVLIILITILGLIVGSFLNVVVYRIPNNQSIVKPGSKCPRCETPIKPYDNIPVISWFLLRGKCRNCKNPISFRYPTIELLTGLAFSIMGWWSLTYHPVLTPLILVFVATSIALTIIDIETKRLPNKIVFTLTFATLIWLPLAGLLSHQWPVIRVLESLALWFFFFAIPWFISAGRWMGYGDVKLSIPLGLILGSVGWSASIVGLMSGFILGAVISVILLVVKIGGRKVPYGPYMLSGVIIGLLAGEPIVNQYLQIVGLA